MHEQMPIITLINGSFNLFLFELHEQQKKRHPETRLTDEQIAFAAAALHRFIRNDYEFNGVRVHSIKDIADPTLLEYLGGHPVRMADAASFLLACTGSVIIPLDGEQFRKKHLRMYDIVARTFLRNAASATRRKSLSDRLWSVSNDYNTIRDEVARLTYELNRRHRPRRPS